MKNKIGLLFLFCTFLVVSQTKIDTVAFKKNTSQSNENKVYNSTRYELQKFNAFKIEVEKLKDKKKYLSEIHSFTKDSLQILAVKLISIKELDKKNLLAKDISENRDFYTAILKDLKASEINPNEYLFLENILTKISIVEVENKYAYSKWLNVVLGISFIGLLIFAFNSKFKRTPTFSLSKQETTVKNLILKGKSNKEIAQELFISLSTVKTHITNIYQKLNISNRDELSLVFKNGTGTST